MPTLPIQQKLLQGAFKYARKLQELRRHATGDQDLDSTGSSAPQSQLSLSSDSSDAGNSISSSLSSISSLSSGSLADDIAAGYEADSDDDLSTDPQDAKFIIRPFAALHRP